MRLRLPPGRMRASFAHTRARGKRHEPNRPPSPFRHQRRRAARRLLQPHRQREHRNGGRRAGDPLADPMRHADHALLQLDRAAAGRVDRQRFPARPELSADAADGLQALAALRPAHPADAIYPLGARLFLPGQHPRRASKPASTPRSIISAAGTTRPGRTRASTAASRSTA